MDIELRREDFLTQYPPFFVLNKKENNEIWRKRNIHLYVHIPFCVRLCDFCYYKSINYKSQESVTEYLKYLKKEIKIYSEMPEVKSSQIKTIYFGGGSPTLLKKEQLEEILTFIKSTLNISDQCEICFEARPGGELTLAKLELLKSLGLSRLSVGCQSVDNDVLMMNGRNHSARDFFKAWERIKKADIQSVNIDLMSGMVNQSFDSWMETLDIISDLRPENIAIYKLELYLNNELYKKYRDGLVELSTDSQEIEFIRHGYKKLQENGYILIDHFSFVTDPKFIHVHRRRTWAGEEMLGVGLSSHSCLNGFIYQNENHLKGYYKSLDENQIPIFRSHRVSVKEKMIQRIVFGIKNSILPRVDFKNEFGMDVLDIFSKEFDHLKNEGLVNIGKEDITTTFDGAIFADDIVRLFFLPEHKNSMLAHVQREFC